MPAVPKKKAAAPRTDATGGIIKGLGGMPDRVWFSCNAKLNTGNYESMGLDAGVSSDVREGETISDAFERIKTDAIGQLEAGILEIRASTAPKTGFSSKAR